MNSKIKLLLDNVLIKYNRRELLSTDPVQFPHRYQNPEDAELVAFICSAFAYGNVKAMNQCLEDLFAKMGNRPYQYLKNVRPQVLKNQFSKLYYRFYSPTDIICFLQSVSRFIQNENSISHSLKKYFLENQDWDVALQKLFLEILPSRSRTTYGTRYFLSDPVSSTAKRARLLMRWMARKDEIDLGLWDFVPKAELVVPLDTHIFNVSRRLKLLDSKTINRNASIKLTSELKKLDPNDPLRYDFALCRVGMFGEIL